MADMTREQAHATLDKLTTAMRGQFGGNPGRLEQLDAHAATVGMVVDHLFDEAETG